jgi:hypothetical protein
LKVLFHKCSEQISAGVDGGAEQTRERGQQSAAAEILISLQKKITFQMLLVK